MKSYYPHSATVAYRAVEYLKTMPESKTIAARALADQIDSDIDTVVPCMEPAVRHGLVRKEKINGLIHFSIGDGQALPVPTDDDDEPGLSAPGPKREDRVSDGITAATLWGDKPAKPKAKAAPKAKPKRVKAPAPDGIDMDRVHITAAIPEPERIAELTPVASPQFAYTWCSTGVLSVSKGGQSVAMTADEYKKLGIFITMIGGFTHA